MFSRPSEFALSFIIETKAVDEPAIYSPKAVQASFAEATITALSSSSTVIVSPTSSHICEPPIATAFSPAVTLSSSVILPLSIASSTKSILISFVTEAGETCS